MLRVGRMDSVDQRLDVALDHGQRRAQLMADVGQQRAALLLVGLESGRHRVESASQLLDRPQVRSGLTEAHGVVAVLDPTRRSQQPVQIAPGTEQSAQERRQHDDCNDDDDHELERAKLRE